MPVKYTTDERTAAFWAKVDFTDSCWLWLGCVNNEGYGKFRSVGNKNRYSHRYSYEFCVKEIPDGLTIDHLCRVRHCVNPDHLEPVTMRVNALRGISPAAHQARQTHCKRGHEFTEENTYHRPDRIVSRTCRECERVRERDRWQATLVRRRIARGDV